MKKGQLRTACSFLSVFALFTFGYALGETEINLDDAGPAPTQVPIMKQAPPPRPTQPPAVVPTVVPTAAPAEPAEAAKPAEEAPTETPVVVHGVLKARDVYEAGIKAYKEKDYTRAIKYLNKSITMPRDRATPKFYLAEAHATLGVIYQFHIIHYGTAYRHYREALMIDKNTPTAKRHIKEVYKYRHRKD